MTVMGKEWNCLSRNREVNRRGVNCLGVAWGREGVGLFYGKIL